MKPKKEQLYGQWEAAKDREEKLSQTMFSHRPIKVEDVARELQAVRSAIGSGVQVAAFTKDALRSSQAIVSRTRSASPWRWHHISP